MRTLSLATTLILVLAYATILASDYLKFTSSAVQNKPVLVITSEYCLVIDMREDAQKNFGRCDTTVVIAKDGTVTQVGKPVKVRIEDGCVIIEKIEEVQP